MKNKLEIYGQESIALCHVRPLLFTRHCIESITDMFGVVNRAKLFTDFKRRNVSLQGLNGNSPV